ncbi:DNA methyltransferase [Lysobacteraceae bacterium NML91-0213]|nr:DNA methyltransferase [Xanthomonadaceae bacterium NML91-0213]
MRQNARCGFARQLRREMTDAEQLLWFHLRNRALAGMKFRRQCPVGPFVADFLCAEAGLIVEVDGSQHGAGVDAARTRFLARRGYRVLRFWNHDVLVRTTQVLEAICEALPHSGRN